MSALELNLAGPIREAIIGNDQITALLKEWNGEPAVFTRRPLPADARYPLIVVSPDIALTNEDALVARRPIVLRDVAVYGEQASQYRDTEDVGYLLRAMFHREKFAVTIPGYSVVELTAAGPMPAPSDDETFIGRLVALRFRLRDLAT